MVSYCHELKFLVRALRKYLPRIYINTQLKCCASNHSWKVGNTLFDFWLTTSLGLFESIKGVGGHKDTASGFHWLRMGIDKPFKTWNTTWRSRYVYIWVCVCVCVICINEMQMICLFFFYFFFAVSCQLLCGAAFIEKLPSAPPTPAGWNEQIIRKYW